MLLCSQVHRGIQCVTAGCTILGFILIFIHADGYSHVSNTNLSCSNFTISRHFSHLHLACSWLNFLTRRIQSLASSSPSSVASTSVTSLRLHVIITYVDDKNCSFVCSRCCRSVCVSASLNIVPSSTGFTGSSEPLLQSFQVNIFTARQVFSDR